MKIHANAKTTRTRAKLGCQRGNDQVGEVGLGTLCQRQLREMDRSAGDIILCYSVFYTMPRTCGPPKDTQSELSAGREATLVGSDGVIQQAS